MRAIDTITEMDRREQIAALEEILRTDPHLARRREAERQYLALTERKEQAA